MNASYGWVPVAEYSGEECALIHGSRRWWMRASPTWWQVTDGTASKTGPAKNLSLAKLMAEQEYKLMRQR